MSSVHNPDSVHADKQSKCTFKGCPLKCVLSNGSEKNLPVLHCWKEPFSELKKKKIPGCLLSKTVLHFVFNEFGFTVKAKKGRSNRSHWHYQCVCNTCCVQKKKTVGQYPFPASIWMPPKMIITFSVWIMHRLPNKRSLHITVKMCLITST